jgi:FKBP12-rapamycin binding domain
MTHVCFHPDCSGTPRAHRVHLQGVLYLQFYASIHVFICMFMQALLVSRELIRVAILWHEQWHEGLEEASR